VIEKITRMPYEDYVKQEILAPIGVHRMRLGHTTLAQRADGEVVYYDIPGAPLVWARVRGGPPVVPAPYALTLEAEDSCAAWVASAIDLVRFALALDEQSGHELLLKPGTLQQTREDRVAAWAAPTVKRFYGLGWMIDVARDGAETWWHGGAMPGTAAALTHRPNGIVYAVLFNSGPWTVEFGDLGSYGDAYQAIAAALDSIEEWPEADLFESYR
jgi:N-acyl-D-amino-acid deacylase